MSKNTLFVLLIFQFLMIPVLILQKLALEWLMSIENESAKIYLALIQFIIPLIYMILFIIFLAMKKYWFILIMVIMTLLIGFYVRAVFHITMLNYRHMNDLNYYESLIKIEFWITIFTAISFIWTDRKKLSWLSIHGFLLAVITSFSRIYISNEGQNYDLFFKILTLLPTLVFIPYFISEYKKAE